MERLNEILSRSTPQAQRRQRAPEQRPRTGTGQGQRADQLPQPLPQSDALERSYRPPLPEQTANLGRPIAPAPRGYNQPGQYNPPSGPLAMQGEPPSLEVDARPAYPRRPPSPRDSLYTPASDYYRADAYASMNRADVVEEWEDDVPSMRYGDWEGDEQETQAYPHPETETAYAANHSLIVRELPSSLEARPYLVPPPRALPVPSPLPQVLPQEVQHYQQRTTQPLHPRSPLRMSQNMPPEGPPAQVARPTRQLIPSEHTRQSIPAPYTASTQVCKICKGAGYLRADVPFGHPNFGRPIACECKETERKEKRRWQLQEISNLGDLKHKSFENFRPNVSKAVYEAYHIALDYARDPQGWLVFIGRNGCGKTHLAAAIANRCLSRGSLVLFSTVIDLLEHLRATFVPTSTEVYDQLFAKMREAELLVLDDLGAQQSSPWANEKLFQLLNYRYNSQFPTIITTNNPDLQGIEERIRSRMTDASLVITVSFDSTQDYRPRNPRRR